MESSLRLKETSHRFVTISEFEDEIRKVKKNTVTIRKNYLNNKIFIFVMVTLLCIIAGLVVVLVIKDDKIKKEADSKYEELKKNLRNHQTTHPRSTKFGRLGMNKEFESLVQKINEFNITTVELKTDLAIQKRTEIQESINEFNKTIMELKRDLAILKDDEIKENNYNQTSTEFF